jgi:integrase/recombinase XerD
VVFVPRNASARADIAVIGAHRLRHTAATRMLQAGASLREVGQVLRHDRDQTTALYLHLDREGLSPVVRRWPETAR